MIGGDSDLFDDGPLARDSPFAMPGRGRSFGYER
jgi:hypothetical protein